MTKLSAGFVTTGVEGARTTGGDGGNMGAETSGTEGRKEGAGLDLRACVPDRHTLVRRMRDYRYRAGVTAEEAACRIGKMATTVYKYEAGRLRVSEGDLLALLDFYGVSLERAFVEGRSVPLGEGRRKDPAALTWRKLGEVYRTLPPAQQRLLLDVARSMSGGDGL